MKHLICLLALFALTDVGAQENDRVPEKIDWSHYIPVWLPDLPRATADEPRLPQYDEAKAAQFLDHYAVEWTEKNGCGTCHTNVPALMARPLITGIPAEPSTRRIRTALLDYSDKHREKPNPIAVAFMVPGASALAINDAESARPLDPRVADLWDFLYAHQSDNGGWIYPDHDQFVPFLERDTSYMATLAALAAGYMPGYFEQRPRAQLGLARLKTFLSEHFPEKLHGRIVLLWASVRLPGLLTPQQQADIQQELLARQNPDGGWTLAAFGRWPRHDGAPNDPGGPSDGYATGLASVVLCERGLSASDPHIQKSVAWIDSNQRSSGRWYTRSLFSDEFKNYLSNMGTAYAVMAIHRCQPPRALAAGPAPSVSSPQSPDRGPTAR